MSAGLSRQDGGGGRPRGGCSNASGRLSPPALMVRSQAGSGLRGSIWGPRLPPPSPSLTSQRRLQSTNAVYWGGSPPVEPASGAASAVLWMQILVFVPQRLLQSLKVFQPAIRGRRGVGGGELSLRHWGGQPLVADLSQAATFSLEVAGERCPCVQQSAISRPPPRQPCKINIPPSHQLAAHGTTLVTKRDTDDATDAVAGKQSPRNVSRLNGDDGGV